MNFKNIYQEKLNAQKKEWNVLINLLDANSANAGAGKKLVYAREINAIRRLQNEATKKIKELEQASDERWENVRVKVDLVWFNLGISITQAIIKSS